ncbi:2-polyprenyl-6-methoxyphenol hydroxylase-like oxidoreductase [Mycobacterium florentinum]|uniref:2-polyprenyl-6-methoxyphenol hydroxylase-like oxidoreductase n=1 Tax=Mycobacterium florentinum TaxID=292462 RepID=A0A1X1U2R0_MYCFL|nr:FAD-dependent monooxygenase [Mycobacterium florentinum]MCV7410924.1 FAD-dependent monooxygenase [Mycobacterium florentinum]ORV51125.1 2-polyprenyl-6-methoxyphenol hydroxylase-like oxidoreductase [Mycobacterium florentinum]BBX80263.1 hydroxylase [Mycobacterium florentinum]
MAGIGNHAVVLGASMAGLLAARSLSEFFDAVTVVERDPLPDTGVPRRGVPQGRHLHALLPRGAQVIEEFFPGILDELVVDGAHYMDGRDLSQLHYNVGGHLLARSGSATGCTAYLATRPFLEDHVRARLRTIGNVTLLDEHDIVELTATPDHHRVTGARVVGRRSGEELTLRADLVVDATGRAARTPTWLDALGYDRTREDQVMVELTYVSQLLSMAPDALHELGFLVGPVPGRPRGLAILHTENDTWVFTVFGIASHGPHPDLRSMCEFVEDIAPPQLLAAVKAAKPIGEPTRHRQPSSRWRRYDKLRRFPQGLLVIGDAICSFNPIYGQGMTVAALEALALRDCLSRGTVNLARRFFQAAAIPIRTAWELSANPDLCLPEIEGTPPVLTRLLNAYVDRVLTAAEYDPAALNQFFRVTSLVEPAARLLRPGMLWRAALANRRRPRPSVQYEAGLVRSVAV